MTKTRPTVGRPRDPELESRVFQAACEVYGRAGWAGFTLDKVSHLSGVGKASIYLRWPDKATLLTEALKVEISDSIDADTGTLRTDLLELARQHTLLYLGPYRDVVLRIISEGQSVAEIRPRFDALTSAQARATRAVVRRGVGRGELSPDVAVTRLLDALFGSILMHAITTPEPRSTNLDDAFAYAESMVDYLLQASA